MTRSLQRLFALLALLALVACSRDARPDAPVTRLDRAEAARADWRSPAAPAQGWTPVKLIDDWAARWPGHDGVVWYRLRWQQSDAAQPTGLLLDYVCLANAVYVNGSLVHRDPQLVEPLSRSWTRPQYFLLDRPLLRPGENELLVRVSGLSAYQPGLGQVHIGDPAVLTAQYRRGLLWRHDMQLFDQAVGAVLGVLFLMVWLLRRRDTVYGWFGLGTVLSAAYGWNFVAESPWPFPGTDGWQAFVVALHAGGSATFSLFLLRYCGKRWPWVERALLLFGAATFVVALAWSDYLGPHRDPWVLAATAVYYAATLLFIGYALRRGTLDQRLLAACMSVQTLASVYDLLLYLGVLRGDTYILALTSPLTLLGMGFILAYRLSVAMRRVEGFNTELRQEVDRATAQLGQTLAREHRLALDNTRIGERLNLVRDLHDGFGGTLLGAIAALEHSDAATDPQRVANTLREMRDDLRLVIDTTTQSQDVDLLGLLAPLRHRWSQRLEAAGIDSRWRLDALEGLHPGAAPSLDLMRLLQEALTNVYKHSDAGEVEVVAERRDGAVLFRIRDDGRGFDPAQAGRAGAGLASLHARALRLGAPLQLESSPGTGTTLHFRFAA